MMSLLICAQSTMLSNSMAMSMSAVCGEMRVVSSSVIIKQVQNNVPALIDSGFKLNYDKSKTTKLTMNK